MTKTIQEQPKDVPRIETVEPGRDENSVDEQVSDTRQYVIFLAGN